MEDNLKIVLGRLLLVVFAVVLMVGSAVYLNSRWGRIRDIRRTADAQSVIKALNVYNFQFGAYPDNLDNDGEGWDNSNDPFNRSFLEPLTKAGLISNLVFDPQNDAEHYYRYQKFPAGQFGCSSGYAVFQVTNFETKKNNLGYGFCPDLNWTQLAPNGFTWFSYN